jgi:hypothetical protein
MTSDYRVLGWCILIAIFMGIGIFIYDALQDYPLCQPKLSRPKKIKQKSKMKPWTIKKNANGQRPTDEFTLPLWADFKPKDFYFAIRWEDDVKMTVVCIVPVEYFDSKNEMLDDSMPIVQYLPNYLEEIVPGMYETDVSPHEVRRNLVEWGFRHNHFFQKFIDTQNGNRV